MSFPTPPTILRRLGLRPKKAWGQHFLLYPHIARRIVTALDLPDQAAVVEIGGGLGALTFYLAEAVHTLIVLELDPRLAAYLQEEVAAAHPGAQILCQDALTFDFQGFSEATGRLLTVVGNLPYQITSPLLFKLIEAKAALSKAVFMMQQEVGQRLLASPGNKDYGILTVLLQYHFTLARLFSLSPANFYPPPQVDSVVLSLIPRRPEIVAVDEAKFAQVVKMAFAPRRKTLNNTLAARAAALGLSPASVREALLALNLDPGRRGETLSPTEFIHLSNRLQAKATSPVPAEAPPPFTPGQKKF